MEVGWYFEGDEASRFDVADGMDACICREIFIDEYRLVALSAISRFDCSATNEELIVALSARGNVWWGKSTGQRWIGLGLQ